MGVAQKRDRPEPFDRGTPGESARRRYDALTAAREQRVRTRFGRLGGLALATTSEPRSTAAWQQGSRGERTLGRYLESLHDPASLIVLHDRRIPGTKVNIDHVAITGTRTVWVIDAKKYAGKVQRMSDGWRRREARLVVGGRDRTDLVHAMARQVDAIGVALGPLIAEFTLTVRPALCFVDAERALFEPPFEIDGVWIGWRRALGRRLRARGSLAPEHLMTVATCLAGALPPA